MPRIHTRVLLLCSMLAAAAPYVHSENRVLTAEDIFDLETVSDPRISPDGSRIVYVRNFSDIMTDRRYSNLWMIRFDGSGHRPLTSGKFSDTNPCWSPDGSMLLYRSDRSGSSQIHKRWMDTGQDAIITNLEHGPGSLSWSPDGRHIAFTMHIPTEPRAIVDMPEKPEGAEWSDPARVIDRLVYRFNGTGYAFGERYTHLFVMPAEGGTPRQLSQGDFNHDGGIAWTPDSRTILMSVNRRPDWEVENLDSEIYAFSAEDGTMTSLTDRRGPDSSPHVSPRGDIAYVGFDDAYRGFQVRKLYLMDAEGSGSQVLLNDLNRSVGRPRWSADGRGVYFVYTDGGNTKLAYVSTNGDMTVLTGDIGGSGSAYGGGSYDVAPNGNIVLTLSRPDLLSEIAVCSRKRPVPNIITAVNEDVLGHRELGRVEEIRYTSSYDGRSIQGWILKPPGFDPSRKYPLVLEIHGGPFAAYGDRFDIEKQIIAAHGYVVLYTNPRGSTSYGEEFADLIHHAYPGYDLEDLNSGVDAVLGRGYIDEDNLFVTGGSGGGVLTCWVIGHTTRFRGAVTVYPVINWYSWILTTDIPYKYNGYWFPGKPWDHAGHYESRNLLSVVRNVTTPTMVLCGEEDWRCPISESEQYYAALKLMGVEAVLVRVPGEPHGIRVRPSHHISKVLHIVEWFNRHRE